MAHSFFDPIIPRARRVKAWLERFATHRAALWILFCVAFIEASVFPISVDALLIPLGLSAPRRSMKFALIATVGSIAGGYLGYFIGAELFGSVGETLLRFHGMEHRFSHILELYHRHGFSTLVFGGFLPLPYILFTFAAGFRHTLDLWTLTAGLVVGRSLRFFAVGGLLITLGPRARLIIEKYFEVLAVVFIIAVIAGLFLFRWLR